MDSIPTTTPANILNAVDYFKAKLQFEQTPHGLKEIMNLPSILIVDFRDRESFEKEHIKGAQNVPLADLPRMIGKLPKDKTIVGYCWSLTCHLAPKALLELAHRGFKVQELVGGIAEWKKMGMPIESSSQVSNEPQVSNESANQNDTRKSRLKEAKPQEGEIQDDPAPQD